MLQIVARELCVGCGGCVNACPTQSITMVEAEAGFYYPLIARETCVDCGRCQDVCPALHHEAYSGQPPSL